MSVEAYIVGHASAGGLALGFLIAAAIIGILVAVQKRR